VTEVVVNPKVLVSRAVFPEVLDRLTPLFEVDYHPEDAPLPAAELARRLADKQGALTMLSDRIDASVLAGAPHLRVVCNVAVGYNNFDLPAIERAGVLATNTPGVLNDTTADTAWALILASGRRVVQADRWVRDGQWKGWKFQDPWLGTDVHHATLGILGMGRIGQGVARRGAHGFGMKVIYHNRSRLDDATEAACGATYVSKAELLAQADHLVLVVPYSAASHHAIGAAELAQMKPTATLVNIARGGIVDDAALAQALKHRQIAAAGLDVFEGEPSVHPDLLTVPNVVLTPHIASATLKTRRAMADLAADNAIAFFTQGKALTPINPEVLGTAA
jgi:gluconate 2-dehydrogenase